MLTRRKAFLSCDISFRKLYGDRPEAAGEKMLEEENAAHPLTDEQITARLKEGRPDYM